MTSFAEKLEQDRLKRLETHAMRDIATAQEMIHKISDVLMSLELTATASEEETAEFYYQHAKVVLGEIIWNHYTMDLLDKVDAWTNKAYRSLDRFYSL